MEASPFLENHFKSLRYTISGAVRSARDFVRPQVVNAKILLAPMLIAERSHSVFVLAKGQLQRAPPLVAFAQRELYKRN